MSAAMNADVTITLVIDEAHAFALAELCKRISFDTCREISVNHEEAYAMIHATNRLRDALVDQGVIVR